jgi:hypothetical protein
MGGGGEETSTQTSKPTNPMVDSTLTSLLGGLQSKYNSGEASGIPSAVNTGIGMQYSAAMNPDYMRGVNGATSELADIAGGKRFGMDDPGYAALRAKAGDDTLRDVNSMFTASGRFGSGSHVGTATEALGNVNAGMDYNNFQNDQQRQFQAISAMPGNFAAGQAPGSAVTGVGQQQQAAPWWNLNQASSVLAGTAGAGGTTSTMSQPATPWWQSALGYVAGNAGKAVGMM